MVIEALRMLLVVELIGLGGTPLAGVALRRLPGAGLGLGKVAGLLLVTWLIWLGGATTLIPYGVGSAALWIALVCALGLLAFIRGWDRAPGVSLDSSGRRRLLARAPVAPDRLRRRLGLASEAVFLVTFVLAALLVAYSPEVWNTEKPMDMSFVNATNLARTFPPADPWLAGADLNYYYLGHLALALPIKLAAVEPSRGYNVALALVLALTASALFTVAAAIWAAARGAAGAVRAGLGAVALVIVLGNLEGVRLLLADGGPPRSYDWFAASRVIPETINEFPWFSFLLGDLHAHLLALPFTLLVLAFPIQVVLAGPCLAPRCRAVAEAGGAALALGALYAINSWSYPVLAGMLVLAVGAWLRDPRSRAERPGALRWLLVVLALSMLAMLPFHLSFDPAARGLGWVSERAGLSAWLTDVGLIYGVFAALVAIAFAGRLAATRRPLRNGAWIVVAALLGGALLAQLDWAGIALLAAALLVALRASLAARTEPAQRVVWLLVSVGVACLLGPELVYVRDEFDGGALYRMNTVFKLGYQAWLMLGLAAIGVLAHRRAWVPCRPARWSLTGVAVVAVLAAAVYPVAGTYARKGGFATAPTLDGLGWLRERAPGDIAAIEWLRRHGSNEDVVLEAVGDDYSASGHARIASFTGIPTVLGWPGHERQWDHEVGSRREDVALIYETPDPAVALRLLRRYGVRFVVVGPIERADHGDAGVAKWDRLGRRAVDRDGTVVWEL